MSAVLGSVADAGNVAAWPTRPRWGSVMLGVGRTFVMVMVVV